MTSTELENRHLAELHALAADAGVPGFRLLRREELIERLREAEAGEEEPPARGRWRRGRRGAAREPDAAPPQAVTPAGDVLSKEPQPEEPEPGEPELEAAEPAARARPRAPRPAEDREPPARREEADLGELTGLVDVMPEGYGFLRLEGYEPGDGDVYLSASQIKRCELSAGDEVSGPARSPRRGERHPALVRVERINGADPEEALARKHFEGLTPVAPRRRLRLEHDPGDLGARAVDLLAPLALGQRALVVSPPRAGRTTLLREIARAVAATDGPSLVVVLADERPEEVTAWRRELPDAELAAAAADRTPVQQLRVAELALARAKRRVEAGEDVVLLVDSLTRLAVGYRDPSDVKRFFGAGRELEEEGSGSLTIIATALVGTGSTVDDAVFEAVATNENALIRLDDRLAAAGVFPALAVQACGTSGEEALRDDAELEAVRRLRAELAAMEADEAARALAARLGESPTNAELLGRL